MLTTCQNDSILYDLSKIKYSIKINFIFPLYLFNVPVENFKFHMWFTLYFCGRHTSRLN